MSGCSRRARYSRRQSDGRDERRHLGLVATGDVQPRSVHSAAQPYTFFHMKGDIEEMLAAFQHQSLTFDADVPGYFHPGRAARAVMDGETVAVLRPAPSRAGRGAQAAAGGLSCRGDARSPVQASLARAALPAHLEVPCCRPRLLFCLRRRRHLRQDPVSGRVAEGSPSSRRSLPARFIAARKSAPASTPFCSTRSSSRRSVPCVTMRWRSGRRRSSRNSRRWAERFARNE